MNLKYWLSALATGMICTSSSVEAKPVSKPKALEQIVLQGPFKGNIPPAVHTCYFNHSERSAICEHDKFGARDGDHKGLDLYAEVGTPLYPLAPGIVIGAGTRMRKNGKINGKIIDDPFLEKNGNEVRILMEDGREFVYIHMDKVEVKIGDKVDLDTKLGTVGTTGNASTWPGNPHVHIQGKDSNRKVVDLMKYIAFNDGNSKPASIEDKLSKVNIPHDCEVLRNEYGKPISPDNLIYLTRLIYMENGNYGKIDSPKSKKEFKKGMSAIIHTILNRQEFDKNGGVVNYVVAKKGKNKGKLIPVVVTQNITAQNQFTSDNHYLMDVVKGEGAQQFCATKDEDNIPYLTPDSSKDQKTGKYTLAYGDYFTNDPILQERMLITYQAVLEALKGKSLDPTNGAMYYKSVDEEYESRFPKEGEKAFGQVIGKHSTEKGLEERIEYRYVLKKPIRVGYHYFYNVDIMGRRTVWDNNNNNKKIEMTKNEIK